jgi:hypothetical protein
MSFTITRLLFRMIKKERDFAFVDKIGLLTNTLITTIPNTELQRNGQYGALVVVNPVYKFESQITHAESNVALNMEQVLDGDGFTEYFDSVIDISQRIITTIKKITNSTNDLKSIICHIEGLVSEDKNEKINTLLSEMSRNTFVETDSEIRQVSFVWKTSFFEKFLNISKNGENSKVIFALQDFQKSDMSFSNVRSVIDFGMREFRANILSKLDE